MSVLRSDLLALTPEDLAAFANRGLLKRATKESQDDQLSVDWEECEDGTITATWSDDVVCQLPGGQTLREATCDCAAHSICRHILRTVLAWQQRGRAEDDGGSEESSSPASPWDPGTITDAEIEQHVARRTLTKANKLWQAGILAELLRSAKPSARFHCPGFTVRFVVPGDVRYTQCSCPEPAPCEHAVLAVRAFRKLDTSLEIGVVSEGSLTDTVSLPILESVRDCVRNLLAHGVTGAALVWRDQARRLASRCVGEGLMWPASILEELAVDWDLYHEHDAGFSPADAVLRVAELLLRLDAIEANCAPVPQAFIRGLRTDRDVALGTSRYVGLGGAAQTHRKKTTLTIFLQDTNTGHPVTVLREFKEDPDSDRERKPFHRLADLHALKEASLRKLAQGQLVMQGGKRAASGKLMIGRARAAVNPQSFTWEQLKAPILVEDVAELRARLQLLPPRSFRPRTTAGDFHVCPLSRVEQARFDPLSNAIIGTLIDLTGAPLQVRMPWTERGRLGAEGLLQAMQSGAKPAFIAGHVLSVSPEIVLGPTAYVVEDEGDRRVILPWLDGASQSGNSESSESAHSAGSERPSFAYAVAAEACEHVVLNGQHKIRKHHRERWQRFVQETEASGLHRMTDCMREVSAGNTEQGMGATEVMFKLLGLARDASSFCRTDHG